SIESLVIGSEVIGSKGSPVKVKGVYPQGVRPMYRLRTRDGGSVDCDGRHLWNVQTTAMSNCRSEEWKTVTTDHMINTGLFMPSGQARFYLPVMGGVAQFQTEQLPLDPYLLGVLLGDGCLSKNRCVEVCTQRGILRQLKLPRGHSLVERPNGSR